MTSPNKAIPLNSTTTIRPISPNLFPIISLYVVDNLSGFSAIAPINLQTTPITIILMLTLKTPVKVKGMFIITAINRKDMNRNPNINMRLANLSNSFTFLDFHVNRRFDSLYGLVNILRYPSTLLLSRTSETAMVSKIICRMLLGVITNTNRSKIIKSVMMIMVKLGLLRDNTEAPFSVIFTSPSTRILGSM